MRLQLIITCFCCFLVLLGRTQVDSIFVDSAQTKLDPVKVNFMYSYYEQDGLHSPVTGGIGDEALKDNAFKVSAYIPLNKKTDFNILVGIDLYTSASTDNIDNEYDYYVETSASYADERKYGVIGITRKNEEKKRSWSFNVGMSTEWDVNSVNADITYSKQTRDENTAIQIKGSYFRDDWDLIYPTEFRIDALNGGHYLTEHIRHLSNGAFSIQHNFSKRLKAMVSLESVYQSGLLSTPFHRVYFGDSIAHDIERLPNHKLKIPVTFFANYYLSNRLITKLNYRFYWDDFNTTAHTIELQLPIKVLPFLRMIPFYRFHTQTAAKYFKPFAQHVASDSYYTSDFDLSAFTTHKMGIGWQYSPLYGIFKKQHYGTRKHEFTFKKIEFRTAKYFRYNQDGLILKSYIATLGLTFSIH